MKLSISTMIKRVLILLPITIFIWRIAFSQPIPVTGIVKIESGYPVPGVLIKGKKEKIQTYTDSIGIFKISASPYSTLLVSYEGFKQIEIKVEDKPIDTTIILYPQHVQQKNEAADTKIKSENFQSAISAQKRVSNTVVYNNGLPTSSSGAFFPQFSSKEETRGSKYLFNEWVNGFVVTAAGSSIKNDATQFNYDKISGSLLMTEDKKTAIELDKSQIKAFTLYSDTSTEYTFENIPVISSNTFCQLIAKGSKYGIYKLIKTKFVKSDYHTDGMTSTGNPYDEYIDEYEYYLLTPADNKFETFKLSKKSIEKVLKNEQQKIHDFFSMHKGEQVDETFLKNLIAYLN